MSSPDVRDLNVKKKKKGGHWEFRNLRAYKKMMSSNLFPLFRKHPKESDFQKVPLWDV